MAGVSHRAHKHLEIPQWRRNLNRCPAQPALRNGRIQAGARRALMALGETTTPEIMEYCYANKVFAGEPFANCNYYSTARALESIGAVRVRRVKGQGCPWVWTMDASMGKDGKSLK